MKQVERPPGRRLVGWIAWFGLLAVTARGAGAIARGPLAPPPLADPAGWGAWSAIRTPAEAVFAVLVLVVGALAWYLLAVTALGVLARLWGARRLVSAIDVLTLPMVRRSLHAAIGIGLVGSAMAGIGNQRGAPTMVPIAAVAPGDTTANGEGMTTDEEPPVMVALPEEEPASVPTPTPEVATSPTSQPPASQRPDDWEVQPGDHLWSMAERALGERAGQGDAEVARYWLRLIEANANRLADPDNPDLIFPGQVLVVPAVVAPDGGALP